jgi:hypothetical protein
VRRVDWIVEITATIVMVLFWMDSWPGYIGR